MTVNQRQPKDPLQEIADLAAELCDPKQHIEHIHTHTPNRKRKLTHIWPTIQPGLLHQLHEAITTNMTPDDNGRRTVPTSRPPLLIEAMSQHLRITTTVNRWIWDLQLVNRPSVEANIRSLVGAAPQLDPTDRGALLADLRRWRNWAAILTGWKTVIQPHVPCPNPDCAKMSTLRVDPEHRYAYCRACDRIWDDKDGSINLLAAYIKNQTETPPVKIPIRSGVAGHGGWQTRAGGTA